MSPRESLRHKARWAPAWVALAFVGAAAVQADVQVFGRDRLLDLGEKSNRFLVRRVESARRGSIETSDGVALAEDEGATAFGLLFDRLPGSPSFYLDLSLATGIPAAEFLALRQAGAKRRFWSDPFQADVARKVQVVKARWRADGVSLRPTGRRIYPLGEAAACLVGYSREGKPLAGLELGLNEALQGVDGLTIGVPDREGRFLPMRIDPRTKPKRDGRDVVLTIDSRIQTAAFSAIRRAVEANKASSGSAIVLDPATGDVLAMANWPSFDPERIGEPLGKDQRSSDFNPNVMAALEPGSTFKILTLALALDKGVVRPDEHWNCSGSLEVWAGRSVRCDLHHGSRAHGTLDPMLAIAKSCNVCAATWALRIGHQDFVRFLDSSGLMSKPNLGLPLERAGEFVRDEYAKRLQLATFGFGQSMTCTPIGLASAFSALANGGVRMAPRLIKSEGGRERPVSSAGRLFSPETSRRLLEYMEAVVASDEGTGKSVRIPGYRIAGKTGTAQKINAASGTVEGGGYVSNFVGILPAEKPRALILVMVDHPKAGKYYGATVAGPVFLEIAHAVIQRYAIEPSSTQAEAQPGAEEPGGPEVEVSGKRLTNASPSVEIERRRVKPSSPRPEVSR